MEKFSSLFSEQFVSFGIYANKIFFFSKKKKKLNNKI